MSRRKFVAAAALTTAAAACGARFINTTRPQPIKGRIVGQNSSLGHALRDGKFPAVTETSETGIVIVGGGIGGLAAARRLQRSGFEDFILLELDEQAGGNAVSGKNEVSPYPWGAHYVPIPGDDLAEVRTLFEELGIIKSHDVNGLPIYDEEYLCADPMERLFIHGRWQEGFVPQLGTSAFDRHAIEEFFSAMQKFKSARGSDGRRAFTIPVDESSRDETFTALDRITMAEYLKQQGWHRCEVLRWYVNYCCRDDYGAGIENISAWAGIHYFAARDARAANAPNYAVVTWPEGNGWLVNQMKTPLAPRIRNSCVAWNVENDGGRLAVDYYDASRQKSVRLRTQGVVWAAPHFVAQRVIQPLREKPTASPVYSPWMVANITLNAMPTGRGMDLAWDNVIYDSASLGYVVATHQVPERVPQNTVLTYYQPLDETEPANARQKALARSHKEWCDQIISDLSQAHPDISKHITQLDVWVWGHAMVRPVPGFIWGSQRAKMSEPAGNIVFANSDASGISIFEEAYTRGVRAADTLMQNFNHTKVNT